jgi:hypothetical protein
VSVERKFRADKLGGLLLTNTKDRDSSLETHARYALGGDGPGRINFRRVDSGDVPALKTERDVIAFLRDAGEPQSQTAVENAVTGKAIPIREALRRLAEDDGSPVVAVGSVARPKYEIRD